MRATWNNEKNKIDFYLMIYYQSIFLQFTSFPEQIYVMFYVSQSVVSAIEKE